MRATKLLRVRLDFVLEFEHDMITIPRGFADGERINNLIVGGLKRAKLAKGVVYLPEGARVNVGLHYPRKTKRTRRIK